MLLKWNERPTDGPGTWNLQPGEPATWTWRRDLQPKKSQKTTRRMGREEGKRKRMWQKREGKRVTQKKGRSSTKNLLWVGQLLTLTSKVVIPTMENGKV